MAATLPRKRQPDESAKRCWQNCSSRRRRWKKSDADWMSVCQERTAELEAIFASIPDSLFVADENGISRCNQPALEAYGCDSIEELRVQQPLVAKDGNYAMRTPASPYRPRD